MYERVLLAYDGSREARTALREGALLARRFSSKVFLLCVVAENAGGIVLARDTYRELFDEAMERLRQFGFAPEGRFVAGEPAAQIAAYVREIGADLVVVGHRRKSLFERWWSGETGAYLVDHIGCSLLIARRTISDEEFFAAIPEARVKA